MNRILFSKSIVLAAIAIGLSVSALGQQVNISGPAGSGNFGVATALPNGNIVIVDAGFDAGMNVDAGAVYLYNGVNGNLISTLTGTQSGDSAGSNGIVVLPSGNFLVRSSAWSNGAGAVTFVNGTTGLSGTISPTNSLCGNSFSDNVGTYQPTVLTNGNYVIVSPNWSSMTSPSVGAVTFGSGTTGISGFVSESNSLVGSNTGDYIGSYGVTALTNGNYVVRSPNWTNGTMFSAGAATWGNGTVGTIGVVSETNSLVGTSVNDAVGVGGVTALTNGNYVVASPSWNDSSNGALETGAVTFGNGVTGVVGPVTSGNSLTGGSAVFAGVGRGGVYALSNGNYVVSTPQWDDLLASNVGAVTFCNGLTGRVGAVSTANSLVGSTDNDFVGLIVAPLPNGNFVTATQFWNNSTGAVTFVNGTTGAAGIVNGANSLTGTSPSDRVGSSITVLPNNKYVVGSANWNEQRGAVTLVDGAAPTGIVTPGNSIVGTSIGDYVGSGGVTVLSNGNYVISSPFWDSGPAIDAGAATFASGATPTTGAVSSSNSIVGGSNNDHVGLVNGDPGIVALTNGNYVVGSSEWDNGGTPDAGAATFGNGASGTSGVVSSGNSLVGSTLSDKVSSGGIVALTNGNYVVSSPFWDNPPTTNAGAATFGFGTTGVSGSINASNSLIGTSNDNRISSGGITALSNGNYVVFSPFVNNNLIVVAGAVTVLNGADGSIAPDSPDGADNLTLNSSNSVFGTTSLGGPSMRFAFDTANNQLVVGRPSDNTVTLFRPMAPSAATVSISGSIRDFSNTPVTRATIRLVDDKGNEISTLSNNFGRFRIDGVAVGRSYLLEVRSKGLSFAPRFIKAVDDSIELTIVAVP